MLHSGKGKKFLGASCDLRVKGHFWLIIIKHDENGIAINTIDRHGWIWRGIYVLTPSFYEDPEINLSYLSSNFMSFYNLINLKKEHISFSLPVADHIQQ